MSREGITQRQIGMEKHQTDIMSLFYGKEELKNDKREESKNVNSLQYSH